VGVASEAELLEMDFEGWIGPNQARTSLERVLPDGMKLTHVELGSPSVHARVDRMTYRVDFAADVPFSQQDVQRLLDGPEILVERQRKGKTKVVNLRPVLDAIRIDGSSVFMTFQVSDEGSARPEEILTALGMARKDVLARCTITRTEMSLAST